jgi:di/tricarboxylate transporter
MTQNWWTRRNLVFVLAVVSLTCIAASVVVGLVFSGPAPSAALGPEWQCSRLAFVFTICSRVTQAERAIVRVVKSPACRRSRA